MEADKINSHKGERSIEEEYTDVKERLKEFREEEDAEAGVTLAEVLEEEDQLEEDCDAVLGPSDDKNCSYHLVREHLQITF